MEHIKTGDKMVTKELLNFRTDDKKATDDFTMEVDFAHLYFFLSTLFLTMEVDFAHLYFFL